ncbi:MAG: DUF4388 domain-containing protein [Acidimicrobiales bacterium]
MTDATTSEVPTASLVGALAIFPLNDILSLLADTSQNGELQVVGPGVDGHLWLDGKNFVGATLEGANTITQAVFEMMLLDEGWFYFTSDQTPPAGKSKPQSVSSVVSEVVPQVQEWRDLLKRVPLEATVTMARTTPGPEVQIRADQWRLLTAVGTNGRTVRSVVEELEDDSVVTVRLLRELSDAGLIDIGDQSQRASGGSVSSIQAVAEPEPQAQAPGDIQGSAPTPPPGFVSTSPGSSYAESSYDATSPSITAVPSMSTDHVPNEQMPVIPPPVTADPWAPPGSQGVSSDRVS